MERVSLLINKLKEGVDNGADASKLQVLAQMLLAELQQANTATTTTKVAVVMPYVVQEKVIEPVVETPIVAPVLVEEPAPAPVADPLPTPIVEQEPFVVVEAPAPPPMVELTPKTVIEPTVVADPEPEPIVEQTAVVVEVPTPPQPIIEEVKPTIPETKPQEPTSKNVQDFLQTSWLYDTTASVPTLPSQPEPKVVFELKDVIAQDEQKDNSLNDKLKEQKTEVAAKLQEAPIRDLKKAIGINDRFLFINELFRGDEDMYERSIKTINAFSIFPEAEYWIQRELKVKIGWIEDSDAVRQFDQLVKRRFS